MPNWTSNRIRVDGEPADIRGFQEIDGKTVSAWYIVREGTPFEAGAEEEIRLFTPEEEAELAIIGHRDWYSWSVENWGTKWNACSVEIDEASVEYGFLEIRFETAWSAPVPVLLKMRELFPRLPFDCRWRHEDEDPYPKRSMNARTM
jgi:hypothetical protein